MDAGGRGFGVGDGPIVATLDGDSLDKGGDAVLATLSNKAGPVHAPALALTRGDLWFRQMESAPVGIVQHPVPAADRVDAQVGVEHGWHGKTHRLMADLDDRPVEEEGPHARTAQEADVFQRIGDGGDPHMAAQVVGTAHDASRPVTLPERQTRAILLRRIDVQGGTGNQARERNDA